MSRFRELRQATGMTQEEFRTQFNSRFNRTYTAAAISQFENGKRTPEISALIDFADFFKVSLDCLLGRTVPQSQPVFNDDELQLVMNYRTLDERGKHYVKDAVEMNQVRIKSAYRMPTYVPQRDVVSAVV